MMAYIRLNNNNNNMKILKYPILLRIVTQPAFLSRKDLPRFTGGRMQEVG